MITTETLRPTNEQTLSILKTCYCLIDNYGGSVFYYITKPEIEAEECCILFENKKAKTYKFSLAKAKIWFDVGCLQLRNTEDNVTRSFTVLTKAKLEEIILED